VCKHQVWLVVFLALTLYQAASAGGSQGCPVVDETNRPDANGFISLFNGNDLTGWKRHENLPGHGLAGKWFVEDGAIVGMQEPPGKGGFLTTIRQFENFELRLKTKIDWPFDSGVFLRTGPDGKSHQVTLDYRPGGQIGMIYLPWTQGAVQECPDGIKCWNKDGWNDLRIFCAGQPPLIQVWLNGKLITNFQHTAKTAAGTPQTGGVSLQVHPGGEGYEKAKARFKDIRIRPLPHIEPGFVPLFNGIDLTGWVGDTKGYTVENGLLVCRGANLYTQGQFADFDLRFEFQLTPGANNGLGIRTPLEGDPAYVGMELQILDNTAEVYKNLRPYQYHGSIYGVVPAKRGALKPVGQWNTQRIIANGPQITVVLNGRTIVDADISPYIEGETPDHRPHPGLSRKAGHIGFLGHGSLVRFRNIRVKKLAG